MPNVFQTKSTTGRPMNIRGLLPGDRYGLNDCLVWGEDAGRGVTNPEVKAKLVAKYGQMPGVEVYDATYENDPRFGNLGQFTTGRYYLETLLEGSGGLCTCGHVPEWSIGAEEMANVRIWLRTFPLPVQPQETL